MALQRSGQQSGKFGESKSVSASGGERTTWLKIRLGDQSTPETWLELKEFTAATNTYRFETRSNSGKELVAFINPTRPLVAVYNKGSEQNYFSRERNGRDRGAVCRLYCNRAKPVNDQEGRLYLNGKYHPDGVMKFNDPTGGLLPDSMQPPVLRENAFTVYGGIVGGRGLELMTALHTVAQQANENRKLHEKRLGADANKANADIINSIPGAASAKAIGDELNFGF